MKLSIPWRPDAVVRLAILLLFLMLWGFAGVSKLRDGPQPWFLEKFQPTILGRFPGATASFWLLAVAETGAMALAALALLRREFLHPTAGGLGLAMLAGSLFITLMLGFGLWLTNDFNGGFQQFMYFTGTLLALQTYARGILPSRSPAQGAQD